MPKVTIDGQEFEAQAGQSVIQVALENGIDIPHFCWHPALSVAGNCRMCLVEIEKMPKLAIACGTTISDGMVVKIQSPNAIKAREDVMEFLLVNHPLDCPICDEAGQCKLQDYAFEHSQAESRFVEEKNHKDKRRPLGPQVMFDGERCISCSRCVRFSEEIAQQPVLTFVQRGDHNTIVATPDEGFNSPISMNIIDICPVGALTSRDFRFKARVWDMSFTESVCVGCARGCDIRVGVRNNEVLRLEPRPNPNVNDYWMCDHGRLSTYTAANEQRLDGPVVKLNSLPTTVDWPAAVSAAVSGLKKFKSNEILFIGSARAPIEDNYALLKLARSVFGKKELSFIPHFEGEDATMLLRADRTPNAMGATLVGLKADSPYEGVKGDTHAASTIIEDLKQGKYKAVYALEDDFLADRVLRDAFKHVEFFVCHSSNATETSARADVAFSSSQWTEREGVVVNFQGWAQQLHPAVPTKYQVRGRDNMNMSRLDRFGTPFDRWAQGAKRDAYESWRILQMVANELGQHWNYHYTEDLFEEIAGVIPAFKGMSYESLGELGLPIAGSSQVVKHSLYTEVSQQIEDKVESFGSIMVGA